MKTLYEPAVADRQSAPPAGQVLKGQYAGAYRSDKGKIKGLLLQAGTAEYTIKLPKYLRPMLVRELSPGEFVQVWAYAEGDRWRAINVLPLPECEAETLRQQWEAFSPSPSSVTEAQPKQKRLCMEVCTKGKCYKQGGRQLHSALQDAVDSDPDLSHVSIKATGCMKACKQGPNLRLPNGRMLHSPTPTEALSRVKRNP
ncbi:(2Fe-2S) ferredoxin domain-containing protein [Nodosilinea sp. LEGE 07298]|uniref:(2Fe-2S) ferredoxin domain-containing protein n=1 Tax=Nodosilinea sp. LEGE 07298 TaxID=2777970 RepID=UPI00187F9321|nr:(2Fe-2S) ferredoxin domain-containing protein [Nodosilinea sp. LEGE 07298]MBE9109701.1 (2Fe-2S) ferredoxin domain-containing protein [Nodosilinea sp. LEGE 07298]